MLREAGRRILWIAPILVGFSLLFFWVFSRLGLEAPAHEALPRFLNMRPADLSVRAPWLAQRVAKSDDASARTELVRLGGAALTHILPTWDSLPPEERGQLAVALLPVAVRMGLTTKLELARPQAILLWNRFWQNHGAEFKPVAVQRLVQRVARRPQTMRTREVLRLDTYALPELISKLGSARGPSDVPRIRHLSELASRISGFRVLLPATATLSDARHTLALWKGWWARNRSDFVTLTGPARVVSVITETQYGRWVASLNNGLGESNTGQPVLELVAPAATVTFGLLSVVLVFGNAVAFVTTWLCHARRWPRRAQTLISGLLLGLPAGLGYLGSKLQQQPLAFKLFAVGLLASTSVAALAGQQIRALARERGAAGWRLSLLYPKSVTSPERSAWTGLVGFLGGDLAWIVTGVLIAEAIAGLPGLGMLSAKAAQDQDLAVLMAASLLWALVAQLLQLLSDLWLGALDVRFRSNLVTNAARLG